MSPFTADWASRVTNPSICFSAHTKDIGIAATVTRSESKLAWVTLTSFVGKRGKR